MAALVLRMRLAAMVGALRAGPARAAWTVIGTAMVAALTTLGVVAVVHVPASARSPEIAAAAGSAIVAAFVLFPVVVAARDPLPPEAFRAVRPAALPAWLVLAGAISVPMLGVWVVCVVAATDGAARGAGPIGIVGAVAGGLTCLLATRIVMALPVGRARPRRRAVATAIVWCAVAAPAAALVASGLAGGTGPEWARAAARVLARTPLGAAWAAPEFAASGDGQGGLAAVVAVATVVVLAACWVLIVHRAVQWRPARAGAAPRARFGWPMLLPTAVGAIGARSIRYWFTDTRYLANLVAVPVVAVLAMLPLVFVGLPIADVVLLPAPLVALFAGWLPHNDTAYDSTALWMHLSAAVRGVADRIGRLLPAGVAAVVLLGVGIPVVTVLHGDAAVLPALIGVCASLLGCGLGLSSIVSVALPYPVPQPGDGPFRQPQRTGTIAVVAPAVALLGPVVLSAPALWFSWQTLHGVPGAEASAAWAGFAGGAVVLIAGILIGGALFDRRGTTLVDVALRG